MTISPFLRRRLSAAPLLLLLATPARADALPRGSREDRVRATRALEAVRVRHRALAADPGTPVPSIDEAFPEEIARHHVEDSLRQSAALAERFGRPVTPGDIAGELARMARDTKNPERLREYFDALGNDPVRIGEVLVRPLLVESRIREAFRRDALIHEGTRLAAERAVARFGLTPRLREVAPAWNEILMVDTGDEGADGSFDPAGRQALSPTAFAARSEELFRSAAAGLTEDDDSLHVTIVLESATDSLRVAVASWPKVKFDDWWSEVGSGYAADPAVITPANLPIPPLAAGACTSANAWSPTSVTNAPTPREEFAAVWTGAELVVWSGRLAGGSSDSTGGKYDPATDTWTATSTSGAPVGRELAKAVWTGTVMVVFGGANSGNGRNDGGRYNPTTNSWAATTTTGAPSGRLMHTAVWTGSRMVVWGGYGSGAVNFNTGGRYDPVADAWTPTSTAGAPSARNLQAAVWSGSRMLVWGGRTGIVWWWDGPLYDGARYDPVTDSWSAMSAANAPDTAMPAGAAWMCDQMVVWGGTNSACGQVRHGSRYDPATDTWTRMSTSGAPVHRDLFSGLARIGLDEVMFFGGDCYGASAMGDGGRYDVRANTWSPVAAVNAPSACEHHTTLGAGSQAIVWGGITSAGLTNTGAVYCANVAPSCLFVDPLGCPAQLTAAGTATPATVPQTGATTLTWTLTNNQAACTGAITATIPLPAGFAFVSGSGCSAAGSTVTCNVASLAPGAQASLSIAVTAGTTLGSIPVPVNLSASAGPAGSASANVTVVAGADVVVTKTPSSLWPVQGSPLVWTITVTNNGPSAASSVTLADSVPAGLSAVRDTTAADFAAGTHAGTKWNGPTSAVELDDNPAALPDNQSAAGFVDMTGNKLLLHMDQTSWNGTAGEVVDSSGNGNHGTSGGGAAANANGKLSRGGSFNGTSSYVRVPHSAGLNPSTELTAMIWVRRDDNVTDRKLIGKSSTGSGVTTGWILGTWLNGTSACYAEIFDTANTRYAFGGGTITQGKWAHLAFTWKTGGRMKGYVDGVLVADIAAGPNPVAANTNPVFLGTMPWFDPPSGGYLNGGLDEAAVWTRELSAAEIATIFRHQAASGKFDSRVLDAGSSHPISRVAFTPRFPAGRALPDGGVSETGYPSGNAVMTGNQFLMHLDDAAGATTFVESSGNGLTGTCNGTGCPTQTAAGRFGSAFDFDGGDSLGLTSTAGIPATGAYTIEAWIRPSQISGFNGIVGWGKFGFSNAINALALAGTCTGGAILGNYWNSAADVTVCATGISVGKWSHVVATYDGTWARALYVDGVQVATAGATPTYNAPASNLFVLGRTGSTANFFVGSIDEVAIWSRPLSATEVRDHYLRGVTTLGLQVASCPDAACASPSFKGPDGTANSSWLASSAGATPPSFTVSGIAPSRWYRYRASLGCERPFDTPGLAAAELTFSPAVATTGGSCTVTNSDVACSLGTIAAGASTTVTVTSESLVLGPFTNSATATSTVADPNPSSNTGSASVTVLTAGGDDDGDGVANATDCAPANPAVFSPPTEARDLRVTVGAGVELAWSAPSAPGGTATVYDVVAADAPDGFATAACVATGLPGTTATDPSAGSVVFYLVRARNACGSALGTDSEGTPISAPECPAGP